jgi:ABC-2 type transport system permease protein
MAFSNLSKVENFSAIKVAIVENEAYLQNETFQEATQIDLLSPIYTTEEEAISLLKAQKVEGYIYLEDTIHLVVNQRGINQTILKAFLEEYEKTYATLSRLMTFEPQSVNAERIEKVVNKTEYLKEYDVKNNDADHTIIYFYGLIGMTSLMGGLLGLVEITFLQANLSPQGARMGLVPGHKMKLFLSSMLAATTIQLSVILLLIGYLVGILKIHFGNQLGSILLICVVATLAGISFGSFIAAIVKQKEGIKIGILIACTNVFSILAGTMGHEIKYIVNTNVPFLHYVNPAALISDSFYALHYYETYEKFYTNMGVLCLFIVVFISCTYGVLRRQKYECI